MSKPTVAEAQKSVELVRANLEFVQDVLVANLVPVHLEVIFERMGQELALVMDVLENQG